MNTKEVAHRLVELCRQGKFEQTVQELYSPEIVSVEAEGIPNRIVSGLAGIAEKGIKFQESLEKINSSSISDPIVAENFFTIGMYMNVKLKDMPFPIDMDEVCVYEVRDGKIVKEQFFFSPPENYE